MGVVDSIELGAREGIAIIICVSWRKGGGSVDIGPKQRGGRWVCGGFILLMVVPFLSISCV